MTFFVPLTLSSNLIPGQVYLKLADTPYCHLYIALDALGACPLIHLDAKRVVNSHFSDTVHFLCGTAPNHEMMFTTPTHTPMKVQLQLQLQYGLRVETEGISNIKSK